MPQNNRYDLMKDVSAAGLSFLKDPNDCVILNDIDQTAGKGNHWSDRDSIRYGSIPIQIPESDPLNRQSLSELADYFQTQKESIYRRNRREPLGRSYSYGTQFPDHIAQNPEFVFGKKSQSDDNHGPISLDPSENQWFKKTDPKGIEHEKSVQKKIDFRYDWAAIGVDPNRHRFGYKNDDEMGDTHKRCIEHNDINTNCIISRRENDMQERNRRHRLGQVKIPPTYLIKMDPDHRFGISPKFETNWTAEQCLRYNGELDPDSDIGRRIWKGSAPVQAEVMVHGIASPVHNQRDTVRSCIWPVALDNDFIQTRNQQ